MKIVTWSALDSQTIFGTMEAPIQANIIAIAHKEDASEYVGVSFETVTPTVCTEITTIPADTYYFFYRPMLGYWLTLELVTEVLKDIRTKEAELITVTVGTKVLDGNETAQERMARAYLILGDTGSTPDWKAHDNTFVTMTGLEFKEALLLAGQAQSALWRKYSL